MAGEMKALTATVLALVFAPLLTSHVVHAHGTPRASAGLSVTGQANGVRITLRVGRASYPRDALVRVTVTVENITDHTLYILTPPSVGDGFTFPRVNVRNDAGKVVYPPALHSMPAGLGTGPMPIPVPGHTQLPVADYFPRNVPQAQFVLLRGPHLRASVPIATRSEERPGRTTRTPTLTLQMLPPDPPRRHAIGPSVAPPQPVAGVFVRPAGVRGRLRYQEWMDCDYPGQIGYDWDASGVWSAASDGVIQVHAGRKQTTLTPHCPVGAGGAIGDLLQWHVLAGWPGHSVTELDYPAG